MFQANWTTCLNFMKNTQVFEHNRDHKKRQRDREREIHVVDSNDDNDNDE